MLPISRPSGTATAAASVKPAKMRPSVGHTACSNAPPSMLLSHDAAMTLIRGIDTGSISFIADAYSHAARTIAINRKAGQRRVIVGSLSAHVGFSAALRRGQAGGASVFS